jgi:hypothetical protein
MSASPMSQPEALMPIAFDWYPKSASRRMPPAAVQIAAH